jgi:ATP phosphoribosyltransferase
MALIRSSPSAAVPTTPAKYLEDAVADFQSILTTDQRTRLREIKIVPDADAVLMFTAQLDYSSRSRKGRSIASRLHSVLQSVREFSAIVDTFVSSHPEIAALVWGSVKLTMEVNMRVMSGMQSDSLTRTRLR